MNDDILSIGVALMLITAWATGLIMTVLTAKWTLLVLCIFLPPVSVVYGIGVWFGIW